LLAQGTNCTGRGIASVIVERLRRDFGEVGQKDKKSAEHMHVINGNSRILNVGIFPYIALT